MNDLSGASRDKREITALLKLGYKVIIVCPEISNKNEDILNRCSIMQYNPLKLSYGQIRLKRYLRIVRHWFQIASTLRNIKKDCISCHDLNALFIGWISTIGIRNTEKPKLVYDSHEFEAGRNAKRSRLKSRIIIFAERFLIKKCTFSIMVNDTIAEEVKKLHKLKDKPLVIRNVPTYWEIDEARCSEKHDEFCKALNLPENTFIIMYHGAILKDRGIENLLYSLKKAEDVAAVILGDGDIAYIQKLKQLAEELKIDSRVLFHKAVPLAALWEYVGAADLGMILIRNTCMNHYFSLPNKLFENMQSGTPVVSSNFPELNKIVDGYGIGLCCDPEDVVDIAEKINYMKNNPDQYLQFKNNAFNAKQELIWEKEQLLLIDAYKNI